MVNWPLSKKENSDAGQFINNLKNLGPNGRVSFH